MDIILSGECIRSFSAFGFGNLLKRDQNLGNCFICYTYLLLIHIDSIIT